MDYPIWELAMGGGMLMAIVAIPHVIVSHFAIGGGLLIVEPLAKFMRKPVATSGTVLEKRVIGR